MRHFGRSAVPVERLTINSRCLYCTQVNEDELKDALILVFANKQDLPNAISTSELTEKLGLHNLRGRKVCCFNHVFNFLDVTITNYVLYNFNQLSPTK